MEHEDIREILIKNIGSLVVPLSSPHQMVDGNIVNLSPTIPINISHDPVKVDNVYIGEDCSPDDIKEYTELFKEFCDIFAWLYEEIPSIDPRIVKHEIKTYPNAKPI